MGFGHCEANSRAGRRQPRMPEATVLLNPQFLLSPEAMSPFLFRWPLIPPSFSDQGSEPCSVFLLANNLCTHGDVYHMNIVNWLWEFSKLKNIWNKFGTYGKNKPKKPLLVSSVFSLFCIHKTVKNTRIWGKLLVCLQEAQSLGMVLDQNSPPSFMTVGNGWGSGHQAFVI